jgi:hypothetical protein
MRSDKESPVAQAGLEQFTGRLWLDPRGSPVWKQSSDACELDELRVYPAARKGKPLATRTEL